jgi:hypothetical protein
VFRVLNCRYAVNVVSACDTRERMNWKGTPSIVCRCAGSWCSPPRSSTAGHCWTALSTRRLATSPARREAQAAPPQWLNSIGCLIHCCLTESADASCSCVAAAHGCYGNSFPSGIAWLASSVRHGWHKHQPVIKLKMQRGSSHVAADVACL